MTTYPVKGIFSELCRGKVIVDHTKPQQRKREESERLRGEGVRSSLLILGLKEGKLSDAGFEEKSERLHKVHVLVLNGDYT